MRLALACAVLCWVATSALAKPVWMSGFELPDAPSANGDALELVNTICRSSSPADNQVGNIGDVDCTGSGAPYGCCGSRGVGTCEHNEISGGHVGSHRALHVGVASTNSECGYVSLPQQNKCTGSGTCSMGSDTSAGCEFCTANNVGNSTGDIGTFQTVSAAWNMRCDTLPTSTNTRTIFQFLEGDPTSTPQQVGCNVRVKGGASLAAATLSLYYNSTLIGTSTETLLQNACSGGTAPDKTIGCSSDSDCPGTGAGRCGTCSATSPGNCWWAPIGVAQELTTNAVRCTLYVRGIKSKQGTVTSTTSLPVADIRFGAPSSSEAQAMDCAFDDLVVDDTADPGWGYVAHGAPGFHGQCSVTTSTQCYRDADCPGGETCANPAALGQDGGGNSITWTTTSNQTHADLVRDSVEATKPYKYVAFTVSTGLRAKSASQTEQFWRLQPNDGQCSVANDCLHQDGGGTCTATASASFCNALPTVAPLSIPETTGVVTAVETFIAGTTDATETASCPTSLPSPCRQIGIKPSVCTYASATIDCAYGTETLVQIRANTNDHVYARAMNATAPGSQQWSHTDIQNLGVSVRTTANYDKSGSRQTNMGAIWDYVRVNFQSHPSRTLKDHNKGVKICTTSADCATAGACNSASDYTSANGALRTCGWCENGLCVRDGKIVHATIGDSTNGGTFSSLCVGGTNAGKSVSCSQKDYCSWDATSVGSSHFADHPPGGCNRDDSRCHVCVSRTDENGGSGWTCASDLECPQTGGTCDTGNAVCKTSGGVDIQTIPCCGGGICSAGVCTSGPPAYVGGTCDNSCNGFGAACNSTATCILACPGGTCTCAAGQNSQCDGAAGAGSGTCTAGFCGATRICSDNGDCAAGQICASDGTATYPGPGVCPTERTSWGTFSLDGMSADVLLICARGGERTSAMLQNRFDGILARGEGCSATVGSGHCTCGSDADCGGTVNSCCLTAAGCDSNTVDFGTCRSGLGNVAACTDPTDCASGRTCAYAAPDLISTLEGFNDPFNAVNPNCYLATTPGSAEPCDPASNARAPKYGCLTDAEAQSKTGSGNSLCAGLRRDSSGLLGTEAMMCSRSIHNFGGDCTVDRRDAGSPSLGSACAVDADCGGGSSCHCPAVGCSETLPQGATSYTMKLGLCAQADACGSGFSKTGSGICHLSCSTDADCGTNPGAAAISGICTRWCSGTSGGTRDGWSCTVATQATDCPGGTCGPASCAGSACVCAGRASVPSDVYSCSRDADCQVPGLYEEGTGLNGEPTIPSRVPQRFDGTCDLSTGKCKCMGRPVGCLSGSSNFSIASEYCPAQTARVLGTLTHTLAVRNFHEMERRILALGQSVSPTLLFSTIPETVTNACMYTRSEPEGPYYGKVSKHILSEFGLTADARLAMEAYPFLSTHTDNVHFNVLGATIVGHTVRDKLATLNTCKKTSTGLAQYYCFNSAGSLTTSACSTLDNSSCPCDPTGSDCPAYNSCLLRVCTSDSDCPASTDTCNLQQ